MTVEAVSDGRIESLRYQRLFLFLFQRLCVPNEISEREKNGTVSAALGTEFFFPTCTNNRTGCAGERRQDMMHRVVRYGNRLAVKSESENYRVCGTMVVPYHVFRKILSVTVGCNWKFGQISLRWLYSFNPFAIEMRVSNKSIVTVYSNEIGGIVFLVPTESDDYDDAILSAKAMIKLFVSLANANACVENVEIDDDAELDCIPVSNSAVVINQE